MHLDRRQFLSGCAVVAGVGAAASNVAAADTSARELLDLVLDTDSWGLGDAELNATATVKARDGSRRVLVFSAKSRYYDGRLTKSLLSFQKPADLAGVRFLQIQRKKEDDERYIYLPSMKKVRRISGRARSGSFMTTDFSYADLDRRDLRIADVTKVGEEVWESQPCIRLSVQPKGDDAEYGRLELWVRKELNIILKAEMFSKKGALEKTLTVGRIKNIEGRWFVLSSSMQHHTNGSSTELVAENIKPTQSISDDLFSPSKLEF